MSSSVWSILELIRWTTDYLAGKGIPDPRLDAELLLADTLQLKRLDLYLQFDRPLLPEELASFKSRLLRRARREPLQYIAGKAAFRELELQVDRRVLIPRPETELLVDIALERTAGRSGLRALDVGTGSGAIALSLATESAAFEVVVATDVSAEALQVAESNREAVGAGRVSLREGPGYDPVRGERFDLIVSNPPYVAEAERPSLQPEVVAWEPPQALFAPQDGLEVIAALLGGAAEHLLPGGVIALEIGAGQGDAARDLALSAPGLGQVEILSDLTGRDRFVVATRLASN